MATFEIKRKEDGEVVFSGRISDAHAFMNELLCIRGCGSTDEGVYLVRGKQLSLEAALTCADDAIAAAYAKKCETHRQIVYFDGVCGSLASNTRRTAWVRK